jgi:hypothetical protein
LPRISAFYGIAIYMYYRDHAPPHFHAFYGEFEATMSIETGDLLEGRLPRRARSLVSEWAATHQDELRNVWELARDSQPLPAIEGLE